MSTKSIVSCPDIPATVPEKLDELSSCSLPVEAAKVTSPSNAELSSTLEPASIVIASPIKPSPFKSWRKTGSSDSNALLVPETAPRMFEV